MHRCRNCLDHGELLVLNDAGVCEHCAPIVGAKITAACEKIERAIVSMDGASWDAELDIHWNAIERELAYLSRWTEKAVAHFGVNIERIMIVAKERRSQALKRIFEREVARALAPCDLPRDVKLGVAHVNLAAHIARRFGRARGGEFLADRVKEVEAEVRRRKLQVYLDDAERYEFEGQRRTALTRYRQALYFLHKECSSDVTTKEIVASIEARITELGGTVPKPKPVL
jgi:hypothetical protein